MATRPILTDANGRPFERPEAPPKGAPIKETIAWIRAVHAYNDTITDAGNRAFDEQFRKSLQKGSAGAE